VRSHTKVKYIIIFSLPIHVYVKHKDDHFEPKRVAHFNRILLFNKYGWW